VVVAVAVAVFVFVAVIVAVIVVGWFPAKAPANNQEYFNMAIT